MAGFITAEGIVVPVGSDTYDYVNDQRRLAASVRSIVAAANPAASATIAAAMNTDGRPVADTNPLLTWEADTSTLAVRGSGATPLPLTPISIQTTGAMMAGAAKPANKPWTYFYGYVNTGTGAGGDTRTTANATDPNGYGGYWFGYQGLPTFQGITYVNIMEGGNLDGFLGTWSVQAVDINHIKFKGRRLDGSGWCNGYGGVTLLILVIGWV